MGMFALPSTFLVRVPDAGGRGHVRVSIANPLIARVLEGENVFEDGARKARHRRRLLEPNSCGPQN